MTKNKIKFALAVLGTIVLAMVVLSIIGKLIALATTLAFLAIIGAVVYFAGKSMLSRGRKTETLDAAPTLDTKEQNALDRVLNYK